MKKVGSIQFFKDIDLNLKFDFNELAKFHGADEKGIKEKEVVYRVLQKDTSLQYEIAKDIRLLPVQSLLIIPIFNWSINN